MADNNKERPRDLRELIPGGNLDSLSVLPDGNWQPAHRPLATGWVPPGRGHAEHGTDSDVKAEDYLPDHSGDIAPMQNTYDENRKSFEEIAAPVDPLWVAIVPSPEKTIVKSTDFQMLDDGTLQYTNAVGTYGILLSIPPDPARTKITFKLIPNVYNVAGRSDQYRYTFSDSPTQGRFSTFVADSSSSQSVTYEVTGNQGIVIGYFVMAAYDSAKVNQVTLNAIIETESTIDHNPMAVEK